MNKILSILILVLCANFSYGAQTLIYSTSSNPTWEGGSAYIEFEVWKDTTTNKVRGDLFISNNNGFDTTNHIVVQSDGDYYIVNIHHGFYGEIDLTSVSTFRTTTHGSNSGVEAGDIASYTSSGEDNMFIYQKYGTVADSLDPRCNITVASTGTPGIQTGNNTDTIALHLGNNTAIGIISGNKGTDTINITGYSGNTSYVWSGDGADSCSAGAGNDYLFTPDTDASTSGFETVTGGSSEYWFSY